MVSKPLPRVVTVYVPLLGAVQVHQTEEPPELPAWNGSLGSRVAPTLEPVTVTTAPARATRLEKLSLVGGLATTRKSVALEEVPLDVVTLMGPLPALGGTAARICE